MKLVHKIVLNLNEMFTKVHDLPSNGKNAFVKYNTNAFNVVHLKMFFFVFFQ